MSGDAFGIILDPALPYIANPSPAAIRPRDSLLTHTVAAQYPDTRAASPLMHAAMPLATK